MQQTKKYFIWLVVLMVGFLGYLFISHKKYEKTLSNLYLNQAQTIAQQTGQLVQTDIKDIQDELEVVAQDPAIVNAEKTPEGCQEKVKKTYLHIQSKVSNIKRTDASGKFICSFNSKLLGKQAQDQGSFFNDIKTDPAHLPVLSRVYSLPEGGGLGAALHVAVATKNFSGTVGGSWYFEELNNKYFKKVPFAQDGYITLFDDNGDVLYNQDHWSEGKKIWSQEVLERFNLGQSFAQAAKNAAVGQYYAETFRHENHWKTNLPELAIALKPINILPNRRWVVMVAIPYSDDE